MHVYITPKPLDFNYKMKYVGTVAYIRHCAAHETFDGQGLLSPALQVLFPLMNERQLFK
ncbi:hypothetical protein SAMN05216316_2444 [Nitrosovibrio sp. Nv6]|nr:hypothetical protein SAMN05216316_2444 [Nitrosovibrio sp. Nv6]